MAVIGKPSEGGFEQYTGDVYGWAYRLLGRHHDALDVVQDVFLRWDAQCARRRPEQPRGWLRRVTLNRAIDLRRRRTTSEMPAGAEASPMIASVSEVTSAETGLDRETLRHDVAQALDAVSELQRGVLVAKIYDELTFAQIADELGVAISTVKTHYLRAVRAVRDRLRQRWAGEES
jgi:RNA polymerase sigma-70 factor (ECF subfamily)